LRRNVNPKALTAGRAERFARFRMIPKVDLDDKGVMLADLDDKGA
jgi:hypothetical protein